MLLAAAIVGRSQPSVIEVEFPARPAGQEDVIGLTACCRSNDIDLIYIVSDWKSHAKMGVYDYFELTTLNMAQQGVFGELLHVEGAYIHNLDDSSSVQSSVPADRN